MLNPSSTNSYPADWALMKHTLDKTNRVPSREQAGETLVETLVAVLVSSLAMLMLAMAISVSVDLINKSDAMAKEYYDGTNALAEFSSSSSASGAIEVEGSVTIDNSTVSTSSKVDVDYAEHPLTGGVTGIVYKKN